MFDKPIQLSPVKASRSSSVQINQVGYSRCICCELNSRIVNDFNRITKTKIEVDQLGGGSFIIHQGIISEQIREIVVEVNARDIGQFFIFTRKDEARLFDGIQDFVETQNNRRAIA